MPEPEPLNPDIEPPRLRSLRILVMVLTGTMILGVLTIVVLLVINMTRPAPVALTLPDTITVPEGEMATAFTQGRSWIGVVTLADDGTERIRLFDRTGNALQSVEIGH